MEDNLLLSGASHQGGLNSLGGRESEVFPKTNKRGG